ncbi:Asp-tRNA(Asn)/Glu-tRNA(Gln) amidotransferase subunit GatA [Tepidanaerobacter acetatoxydans]|uniref:Asp-tRNA(Asn)/Glu-tRNA(Gln) amidotransferase subunit GatA n=1 Tax=Tepidanaerobacter acetatoxydans TaxID=499229 RepID=UPI001BD54636|nr:Asp-tRNA(Asn)/Glu-tRNA(Gln) amidotransferase subunit GatA [Tepidanaerobacter acetatoxydans]
MLKLHELTVNKANELLKKKEIKSEELTSAIFNRIDSTDGQIKAYVTLDKDRALETARLADEKADFTQPLTGIPMAVKDNMCTKDLKTTCCSKMLENFVPPYDATVISKLKDVNAVILGKTNMDEFAMGSSTESSFFQVTKNPWNLECVPGGSSGGSAAAVAADESLYALGSDTGGSIRQPAAYCGVVGLKPTYGRVSRFGVAALASTMDAIGPITKDVTDCAIVLSAIAGIDSFDPTSSDIPLSDYLKCLHDELNGIKIGIPKEFLDNDIIDKDVKDAFLNAAKIYEKLGCVCEETSLANAEYALWAYHITVAAESSSELGQYDGIRYGHRAAKYEDLKELYKKSRGEGFGTEVKRRIILGTYLSDAQNYDKYYLKAQKIRTLIKKDFENAFNKYDLLITPTVPTTAFKIGEKIDDPLKMYMNDLYTTPVNLAGLPAISIPCGFSDGLPIGLQIIGKAFDEASILRAAYAFEQNTSYHEKRIKWEEGSSDEL